MTRIFWRKSGPKELPVSVKTALMSQFRLDSQTVDKMRFLANAGRFAGRQVQFIRVFDPALISHGAAAEVKFNDLQLEAGGHRKALLFEGHIEKEGNVLLADRRTDKA